MKKYIVLFFFIVVKLELLAQSPFHYPQGKVTRISTHESFEDIVLNFRNDANYTIDVVWQTIFKDIPAGWDVGMCNNGACLAIVEDTGRMSSIVPGRDIFLKLHTSTYQIPGHMLVKFKVFEKGKEADADTISFDALGLGPNSAAENVDVLPLQLYASGKNIYVISTDASASGFELYDGMGKLILDEHWSGNRFNGQYPQLSPGIYWVSLQTSTGKLLAMHKILLTD